MSDRYDAGLLNDYGGGNVEWWWDYIRSEIENANEFHIERNFQSEDITLLRVAEEMAFALYNHRGAHHEGDDKARWFREAPDKPIFGGPISKQEFIAMASVFREYDQGFKDGVEKSADSADDVASEILLNHDEYPATRVHDFLVVARRISRNIRGMVNQP